MRSPGGGLTTNGLMSSSPTSAASSSARRCTRMIVSTSAGTSAGCAPRTPSSSLNPRSSRRARPASSASNGGTRKVTSPNTSVNTPPVPIVTTGPKSWSCDTPTSISTPPVTISQTSTPSMRGFFPDFLPAFVASVSSSSYVERTSFADCRPTRTSPASLLCSRSGDDTFITTGKPICFAARAASAADVHSRSLLVVMP